MKELYQFYNERIEAFTKKLESLSRKIHLLGSIRLIFVVVTFTGLWLLRNDEVVVLSSIATVALLLFAGLMILHNKLFQQKEYTETLIRFNRDELNGLDYNYTAFNGAKEMINPEHSFGLDLDLFGERSLFQLINRTVTTPGIKLLSGWFIHPLTCKDEITKRQEAVKELSEQTELRHHFFVTGSINKGNQNDTDVLQRLTNVPSSLGENLFWRILKWVFPLLWITGITLASLGILKSSLLLVLFFGCLLISYSQTKKVNRLHNSVNKMEKILSVYAGLMKSVENQPFQSQTLKTVVQQLTHNNLKASHCIKQLSGYLGQLDQRYNLAVGAILNVLLLWDIRKTIQIENWIKTYGNDTQRWFNALAQFDALSSLASYAYNHPGYAYPEIATTYFCMKGKALGHPLIHRDVCVLNDIDIEKSPWFLIITGANMAGKSTYLRTVGVNYLLACVGAPVFASQLTVYPANLVTSLRTADSLANNESYFFAELKRLKMIIDRLSSGEELFIILDEILKGTNSVDKQKGSLALMRQLVTRKTCGIIATHDLLLGSLEQDFPGEVKNFRFEADITNEELTFSYLLREGVAQNMNACFLMKKMGITI